MAENGVNLLGFLKKKNLFAKSPTKIQKRLSNSKESKDGMQKSFTKERLDLDIESPSARLIKRSSQRNFERMPQDNKRGNRFEETNRFIKFEDKKTKVEMKPQNKFQQQNINWGRTDLRNNEEARNKNQRPQIRNPQQNRMRNQQQEGIQAKSKNLWAGVVNYSTSFQSARIQSAQCLQTLSVRIHNEVSSINYRIDVFTNKINKAMNSQLKSLRQRILSVVEEAFKESERCLKEYVRKQEKALATQLLTMKETLEKQFLKIQTMKEDINKPGWRKVAGELLSSELEHKIDTIIRESSATQIGVWESPNLGVDKMKQLDADIKDMVRLNK